MKHTLEYTAENGVKFYIVGIEAFDTGVDPWISIAYTRNKTIVEQAKAEYEYDSGSVPIGCVDMLAIDLDDILETFERESHEEPHVGYVVIKKADME